MQEEKHSPLTKPQTCPWPKSRGAGQDGSESFLSTRSAATARWKQLGEVEWPAETSLSFFGT